MTTSRSASDPARTDLPTLITRPAVLFAGRTDRQLQRSVARHELTRIRPGAFRVPAEPLTIESDHRLRAIAWVNGLGPDTVLSHASAALFHGVSTWGIDLTRVHIAKDRTSGGHVNSGLHTHAAPLETDELTTVDGFTVTSIARTAVDLARTVPFEQAVVLLDQLLGRGLVTVQDLVDGVERAGLRRGRPGARRAIAFASPLSESVGESRSRVHLHRAGLPGPALQQEVRSADGQLVGRGDFWWEGPGVIGEFDGRVKYGRFLAAGESAGDAVFREKRREDALRQLGLGVVRWVWSELGSPELVRRWCAALDEPFRPDRLFRAPDAQTRR